MKLKQQIYTLALASIIFNGYYWVMKKLPSVSDVPACLIGGSLNITNIIFSAVLSFLTALMLVGMFRLFHLRRSIYQGGKAGSLAGLGFIFGFFTVFCALCTIPVISLFGIAIGLGFFTTYNLLFKLLSILIMIVSIAMLNKQLNDNCACNPKKK